MSMNRKDDDVVKYRIIKRTDRLVAYDQHTRPWYSPWKCEVKRYTISPEGFSALTDGKVVEGEISLNEGERS